MQARTDEPAGFPAASDPVAARDHPLSGIICVAPDFAFRFCVDRVTAERSESSTFPLCALPIAALRWSERRPWIASKRPLGLWAFAGKRFCLAMAWPRARYWSRLSMASVCRPRQVSLAAASKRGYRWFVSPASRQQRSLISCGRIAGDLDLRIVDPCSRREVPRQTVGEIWVRGRSVASGYWSDGRADMFCAVIDGDPALRQYLRTGDLGFLWNDELFVTGRIKDMVVVRGRNLHAEDLRQYCRPRFSAACGGRLCSGVSRLWPGGTAGDYCRDRSTALARGTAAQCRTGEDPRGHTQRRNSSPRSGSEGDYSCAPGSVATDHKRQAPPPRLPVPC